jgi:diaminopimelate decarboxylase
MPVSSHLSYRDGRLHHEDVDLQQLADVVDTPFYCYSRAAVQSAVRRCRAAFDPLGVKIHYAVKANSNISVLRLMAAEGLGADIVSGGELERALQAGIRPGGIVFSGVGKQRRELELALRAGVGQFNIESLPELELLAAVAGEQKCQAAVAVRINPDVDAGTHRHITTGVRSSKFGIPLEQLEEALAAVVRSPQLRLNGLAVHIGSQIQDGGPYRAVCRLLADETLRLRGQGLELDHVDLGGGFGVDYGDGRSLDFATVAEIIEQELLPLSLHVSVEPGRSLVADAGVMVSRVLYRKAAQPPFLILDAGMNDLMRPALYQAVHPLLPLAQLESPWGTANLVGPICESTDLFQRDAPVPAALGAGDLVALQQAGAYAAVMSGTYNSRDLIPEVMVEGAASRVIRRRLAQRELMALED